VQGARNLGLLAFDLLPPAKAALSSLSIGAAGRIPKLARGVPLGPSPRAGEARR
jgi:2-octaprenyl-6-methoxyphenol hydroxylase